MKAHKGNGNKAPRIYNLGTRCKVSGLFDTPEALP